MVRSLLALRNVDAGFDPNNVLTMNVSLPETRYATSAQRSTFYDTALQRLRALPGVEAAGAIDDLPFLGGSVQPIVLEDRPSCCRAISRRSRSARSRLAISRR